MTAFPSNAAPLIPRRPKDIIDEAVTAGRATQQPGVAEMRSVPRMSIAEINQSDLEQLRDRYLKQTYDDRGPVTKFLDLVDAPRNVILGALAPGLESRARAKGETAAFGRGRVNFSDVLGEMGIENRVARGVLGFVGDVAFDPLTYLGPAGLGAKVALKGGGQLGIRKAGVNFLREGSEALAKGSAVDPIMSGLAKGVGLTEGRLNVIRSAADKERALGIVRRRIEGDVTTGKFGQAMSRVGLNENEVSGGAVSKLFQGGGPDEGVKAAREFVGKFGKGTEPGIGKGTSQIAHIPFTDIGIRVPAISNAGRTALTNLKIAADTENGAQALREFEQLNGIEGPFTLSQDVSRFRDMVVDETNSLDPLANQRMRGLVKSQDQAIAKMQNAVIPEIADTPSGLFALAHAKREAQAVADQTRSIAERYESVGKLAALADEDPQAAARLRERLDELQTTPELADQLAKANARAAEAADTLAQLYAAPIRSVADKDTMALADVAKRALGTSDDVIGTTAFGSMKSALRNAGLSSTNPAVETAARFDRRWGQWFGIKGGTLDTLFRDARASGRARAIRDQIGGEISQRVDDLMKTHGIPAERAPEVDAYLTMLAHREAGLNEGFWWDSWSPDWKPEGSDWNAVQQGASTPSRMSELLLSAQGNGLLSPNHKPGFADELKNLAAEWIGKFNEVGDAEVRDGLLRGLNPSYIPLRATRGGAERMARVAANERRVGTAGGIAATQPFERMRSTMQYRFIGPDGKARRFFEFDRSLAELSDKQLAEMFDDPAALQLAKEGRDSVRQYDKMVAQGADVPPPRPTDPWELNELAKTGRFRMLLGAATGDFMETSFPIIAAERMLQHERAVAASNLRQMVRNMGVPMDAIKAQKIFNEPGAIHELPGGVRVTFLREPSTNGTQVAGFRLGDTNYRQLDPKLRGDGAYKIAFDQDLDNVFLPARVADRIEDVAKVVSRQNGPILEAVESVTNAFRRVTLFHPSWIINNVLGNMTLALGGDTAGGRIRIADIVKNAQDVAKLFWNRYEPEKLNGLTFNIRGQSVTGDQLLGELEKLRIADENHALSTLYGARESGLYNPSARGGLRDRVSENLNQAMLARGRDKADALDAVKATGNTIGDSLNRRVFGPWGRLNGMAENISRTLVYLSYVEQGYSPREAAAATLRSLFDYSDLTNVERNLRSLVPFYSWMKNNTAYQFKTFMERPSVAAAFPKIKEAIEESFAGDSAVPENQRPQWMRDALSIQYTRDPKTRQFLLSASALPPAQLYQLGSSLFGQEGIQDVLHYFLSGLNPLATVPISIGTGREIFSGRTIGPDGDITVPRFLLNQIRPFSEIGTAGSPGGLRRAAEQGPIAATLRFGLGGKIQDASDERIQRQQLRDFQEREQKLRSKIRRAEGRGDDESSREARAALLKQYEAMMGRGYAAEVPKWAQRQLVDLQS